MDLRKPIDVVAGTVELLDVETQINQLLPVMTVGKATEKRGLLVRTEAMSRRWAIRLWSQVRVKGVRDGAEARLPKWQGRWVQKAAGEEQEDKNWLMMSVKSTWDLSARVWTATL